MASDLRLARIGTFELRLHHLLIIGILAAAFSVSFMIRAQPAQYGYELNEFDPFFNYRATEFLVENGLSEYRDWHDYRSWYPVGREISGTSQSALHGTAAVLYKAFGGGSSLYDFTIIFPVIFGSLTTVVIFALVRLLGGTTAGLFASLLFAVSVPVLVRGMLGWFKSEPLGLFYGLLGTYLFLSGIKSDSKKVAAAKLVGGGIVTGLALASWGGANFFVMPMGLFILCLPFLRRDHRFLQWAVPVFVASIAIPLFVLDRPGINFFAGAGGAALIGPTVFMIASTIVQRLGGEKHRLRNGLLPLAGLAAVAAAAAGGLQSTIPFRSLYALNPFTTTADPLAQSVAEHAITSTAQSFFFLSILMVFAGLGVWLILNSKKRLESYILKIPKDMIVFALMFGILGAYIGATFIRLELFAAMSVIILSSIGLSILASEILKPAVQTKSRRRSFPLSGKISFIAGVVILLVIPTIIPVQGNWIDSVRGPPTILNGGTNYGIVTQDWPNAMAWLRDNTHEDAIVAAWWDYGYWITALGERISLVDNLTTGTDRIQEVARMLLDDPDASWAKLNEMEADYILIFIAATKIPGDPQPYYLLTGGGDESKKQWFMRIAAEEPVRTYLHDDGFSGTDHFWRNTLLGQMIPYSPVTYINLNTQTQLQSDTYRPGHTAIYVQDIKYPPDGDGPLRLAYASDTFSRDSIGPITAVLIYEVNKDYTPDG